MRLQEDGDTKKLFAAGAAYKTMFECEHFPTSLPPPPVKKIMVPSPGPAGPHGEEETVFFSRLPSPPFIPFFSFILFYFLLSSQLLDEITQKRLPRRISDACIQLSFFRSLPWSPSFIINLHQFTIRSQHATLRKERRPQAVILNYYAKYIDNFGKQSTVEPR